MNLFGAAGAECKEKPTDKNTHTHTLSLTFDLLFVCRMNLLVHVLRETSNGGRCTACDASPVKVFDWLKATGDWCGVGAGGQSHSQCSGQVNVCVR